MHCSQKQTHHAYLVVAGWVQCIMHTSATQMHATMDVPVPMDPIGQQVSQWCAYLYIMWNKAVIIVTATNKSV